MVNSQREKDSKKKGRHSRARTREAHQARVRDLVLRMALGPVTSKGYATETGCTIDEAKTAISTAKAVRAFLDDDDAYRGHLLAVAHEALEDSRGNPHAVAKLIEPISKLRGYIQSGTTVNLMLAFQGTAFEGVKSAQELEARVLAEGKKLAARVEWQCEQALRDVQGDVGRNVVGISRAASANRVRGGVAILELTCGPILTTRRSSNAQDQDRFALEQ